MNRPRFLVDRRRLLAVQGLYAEALAREASAVARLAEYERDAARLGREATRSATAEEDARRSAHLAFVNIARRVQSVVHQQLQSLREMEDRHGGDPAVFGDLLHLDHGTALIGRFADSLAVLGGERPGRQWTEPVAVLSVLRGAMSRIAGYRRVDVGMTIGVEVVGPAVESVVHALAELLDNATRYSPPESRVRLGAEAVRGGVAITVDDAGVGLGPEAAARAGRILAARATGSDGAARAAEGADADSQADPAKGSGAAGLDFAEFGASPRLGLSVVSRLAHANGFEVSLRRSADGGTRAVLFLPDRLVTAPTADSADDSEPRDAADVGRAVAGAGHGGAADVRRVHAANGTADVTDNGLPLLPQRRRRRASADADVYGTAHAADAFPDPPHPQPSPPTPAPQPAPGMWLAPFLQGTAPQGKDEAQP